MTAIAAALACFIYIIYAAGEYACLGKSRHGKDLSRMLLFVAYLSSMVLEKSCLLAGISLGAAAFALTGLFGLANHFVISLFMLAYFNRMMIIRHHNLKIAEVLSAR